MPFTFQVAIFISMAGWQNCRMAELQAGGIAGTTEFQERGKDSIFLNPAIPQPCHPAIYKAASESGVCCLPLGRRYRHDVGVVGDVFLHDGLRLLHRGGVAVTVDGVGFDEIFLM